MRRFTRIEKVHTMMHWKLSRSEKKKYLQSKKQCLHNEWNIELGKSNMKFNQRIDKIEKIRFKLF